MDKTNPFLFESSALPDDARVIAFRGREALGEPFEWEVWIATAHGDEIDLEDALFTPASLTVDRGDERGAQVVRGILAGVDHVHEHQGRAIFSLLVVPRLWLLGQSEHSRIFVDQSFDAILKTVVETVGVSGSDLDVKLGGLPVEEHVCQYRESDLAFLHRWLEREGVTYFFDHSGEAEKLVVTDTQPSTPIEGGPVRYHPALDGEAQGSDFTGKTHFQRLRTKRVAMPRAVKLGDYDYTKPQLAVKGDDEVLSRGQADVVRFGERFFDPGRGAALAKLRGQAMRGKQEIQVAEGNVLGIRPGHVVEIEQHPRAALNQKYLVLAAEHTGIDPSADRTTRDLVGIDHQDAHRVRADLLATAVEYKPSTRTPWPRIHSHELAVVDGPADSEYAQIDDQGRYKVKFLFDEGDAEAGKASTWVRMMQPHAGNPEGMHFPLRKGTEVVVSFLGGDPDRPLIAGAVPNAETPSPVTSSNHTKNILITGGRNKLEIEDQEGQQWINWYTPSENTEIHMGYPKPFGKAQANLGEHTDGTASFTFGGDWYVDVGGLHDEHVGGSVTQLYDATRSETVAGTVTESYGANHDVTIGANRTHTVGGTMTETITGALTQTFVSGWTQTVSSGWNQTISGGWKQTVDTVNQNIGGLFLQNAGSAIIKHGPQILDAGPLTWTTGPLTWSLPAATILCPSWTVVDASKKSTIASVMDAIGMKFEITNIDTSVFNMKAEAGVLSAAVVGGKIEAAGLSMSYTGVDIAKNSYHAQFDGVNLLTTPVFVVS